MTLSIISQDGVVYNYSNAVSRLVTYEMVGADVRPLVLIQFPSGQPETIKAVEEKLESMGYTYDNNMVNIWMSDDKVISDDLTANNGTPAFLLMKQAVSTGWDCPRAKILVKLREGGSEDFQIQTIGRIRRMPERRHYMFPGCLDLCYIYTLDEKYKQGLMNELDKAYQVRKLFLKSGFEDVTLTKEMRNLDTDSGLGERELLHLIYDHFTSKYGLGTIKADNQKTLTMHGYNFSHEIDSKVIQGEFRNGENLASVANSQRVAVKTKINTHTHGIQLMHSVDEIKKITTIPAQRVRNILQRLFRKGKKKSKNCFPLKQVIFTLLSSIIFTFSKRNFVRLWQRRTSSCHSQVMPKQHLSGYLILNFTNSRKYNE